MKRLIKDSIRELALSQELVVPSTSKRSVETLIQQADAGSSSEDDRDTVEKNSSSYDFGLIEPFVVAIKDAIQYQEVPEPPVKSRKYFPHMKKKKTSDLSAYGRNKGCSDGGRWRREQSPKTISTSYTLWQSRMPNYLIPCCQWTPLS